MQPLTEIQAHVLDTLVDLYIKLGTLPSATHIGEVLDVSATTIYQHLELIEKKGWVKKVWPNKRAVRPLCNSRRRTVDGPQLRKRSESTAPTEASDTWEVPWWGSIAAGQVQETSLPPMADDFLMIPGQILKGVPKSASLFALTVRGESMIGDGIEDGDIAIIQREELGPRNLPDPRTICAITIDGESTLKRIESDAKKRGVLYLKPSNPLENIQVWREKEGRTLLIQGKMVAKLDADWQPAPVGRRWE